MEQIDKYSHLIGQVIDSRYQIEKIKGIGSMAVVLKAKDLQKGRTVAIKLLDEKYTDDAPTVKRFVNESKAVALLSNEHIVNIFDVALSGPRKYIVMEFIDGITLKEYLKRYGPISLDKALDFTMQILIALKHAHEKGVVHRDIKPQNIMVSQGEILKVTDFGIAEVKSNRTSGREGVAMGTVYYISPEQASGLPTTGASDIYSVGIMLYEMVSGKLPFEGDTPLSIAMMQVNNTPVSVRKINPKTPIGLEQIIMKAMSKKPEERFRSAASMLRACEIIKRDKSVVFDTSRSNKSQPAKETHSQDTAKPVQKETETSHPSKQHKLPETDEMKRKKNQSTMFPIILGVVSAFVLVATISGIMLVMSLLNMTSEDSSKVIDIPELVGQEYSENLETVLISQNIQLDVLRINDQNIPAGQIIKQNPAQGEKRKVANENENVKVEITVSLGRDSFKLSDFSNKEYRNAKIELERTGLKVEIEERFDNVIISGYVINTEPAKDSQVSSGDTIKLFVSKGKEPKSSKMIDVRNIPQDEAKRKLLNANFIVGNITKQFSDTVPEGYVISQSINPGTNTDQKTTPVNLVVSLGKL